MPKRHSNPIQPTNFNLDSQEPSQQRSRRQSSNRTQFYFRDEEDPSDFYNFFSDQEDILQNQEPEEQNTQGFETKNENSLSVLTKNFVNLIKSKPNCVMDINEATRDLKVQKRRIYDITNVLEGIGFIEKFHKKKMKWLGGTIEADFEKSIQEAEQEIKMLEEHEKQLDQRIQNASNHIKTQFNQNRHLNCLQLSDFEEILEKLPEHPKMMMIVSGIEGSTLECQHKQLQNRTLLTISSRDNTSRLHLYVCQKDVANCDQEKIVKIQ